MKDHFLDDAAKLVAWNEGAIERLRAAHRSRPDGRCTACGPLTRWPCVQIAIAERAELFRRPPA